ncbi:MAG: hypothetical protein AAF602_16715, partial [Myxococcota bacterium]
GLGNLYVVRENWEAAHAQYSELVRRLRGVGLRPHLAVALVHLARASLRRGATRKAVEPLLAESRTLCSDADLPGGPGVRDRVQAELGPRSPLREAPSSASDGRSARGSLALG